MGSQDSGAFRLAERWVEAACPERSAERQHTQDAEMDTHAWTRRTEDWQILLEMTQMAALMSFCSKILSGIK